MVFTICLAGLPSCGKSSIINSLYGKRILQSGICRTTINQALIENITSDDGAVFNIIDTPGICDSEDKSGSFNDIMQNEIIKADIIFWTTDCNTAFITSHEKTEFNNMVSFIEKHSIETGKGYQIGIILSKCDVNIDIETFDFDKITKQKETSIKLLPFEEIEDEFEDTSAIDSIARVVKTFPNYINNIHLFNAHNRCFHKSSISHQLKHFIVNLGNCNKNVNTTFNIRQYTDKYNVVNEKALMSSIIENDIKS